MPKLRPYVDGDWEAVLDLCLLAFAPGCASLERLLGAELDWRTCITSHLAALTRPGERDRLVVAERRGAVVGVVHYEIDHDRQSGSIGLSAVHPARQGKGIASAMYKHVLDTMRAQGARYATAEAGGDPSHAAARRAYEKVGFAAVPTVHYVMELRAPLARVPRPAPAAKDAGPSTTRAERAG
jgi:ribosomal protein S18 acetylase RimI-like enzyme